MGEASPEALRGALDDYSAYFGRFVVHEAEKKVVHSVEGSLLPEREGGELVRYVAFDGDMLELTTAPFQLRGRTIVSVLRWRRRA